MGKTEKGNGLFASVLRWFNKTYGTVTTTRRALKYNGYINE